MYIKEAECAMTVALSRNNCNIDGYSQTKLTAFSASNKKYETGSTDYRIIMEAVALFFGVNIVERDGHRFTMSSMDF